MFLRIMLAALLAAGLASAQRGGGGGNMNGGMGSSGMPRQQRQSKLDVIADKLGLNKEQKEDFQKIVASSTEAAAPLAEQLRNGRQAVAAAMINGKDSGEDWDKLKAAYTAVLAQEATLEAQAYQKLYALLKDKQKTKAAPVFAELMTGMFERTGGGRER
jgi:hypothetical protein